MLLMKTTQKRRTFLRAACILVASSALLPAQTHWVGSWGAAPSPPFDEAQMRARKLEFSNQTVREIVHLSIGGDAIRVRLSNAFGTEMADIGAAHIALRDSGAAIASGSDRPLTFSGRPSIGIPAGATVLSDPVKLTVPAAGDLAISLFIPHTAMGGGVHFSAQQTSYIAAGDQTASASLTDAATMLSWVFLTGVDVLAPESTASVIAFG